MKLSEAILLSIGVVKELRTTWAVSDNGQLSGCAVTTALYSVGEPFRAYLGYGSSALHKYWPWTAEPARKFGEPYDCPLSMVISHRHYQGQSRESIAVWIATIEPQEVEVQPTTNEVPALVETT